MNDENWKKMLQNASKCQGSLIFANESKRMLKNAKDIWKFLKKYGNTKKC